MIPHAFQEFYDPEPDYERIDAAYDARREREIARERPPARDFSDEDWRAITEGVPR